jgi:hypothetical protein
MSEFLAACRAGTLAWEVRPGAASLDLANLQSRLWRDVAAARKERYPLSEFEVGL